MATRIYVSFSLGRINIHLQTCIYACVIANMHTHIPIIIQAGLEKERYGERQTNRHTESQLDRQTDRRMDGRTD